MAGKWSSASGRSPKFHPCRSLARSARPAARQAGIEARPCCSRGGGGAPRPTLGSEGLPQALQVAAAGEGFSGGGGDLDARPQVMGNLRGGPIVPAASGYRSSRARPRPVALLSERALGRAHPGLKLGGPFLQWVKGDSDRPSADPAEGFRSWLRCVRARPSPGCPRGGRRTARAAPAG